MFTLKLFLLKYFKFNIIIQKLFLVSIFHHSLIPDFENVLIQLHYQNVKREKMILLENTKYKLGYPRLLFELLLKKKEIKIYLN